MTLKRYCSRSVLLKKWKLLEVIKRLPKACSTILLIRENRFNPFESVPLTTLRLETTPHQKRMNLQNYLPHKQHNVAYSAWNCFFCKNFLQIKQLDVRYSNIALLILLEVLQSHPFLMSRKFETQGCQWYKIKRTKSSFVDKGNGETRFEAPLYYLMYSSCHFNTPDLEQYIFKKNANV